MLAKLRTRLTNRSQKYELLFAIGVLLALGLLAYMPFANRLGFYRDDWYVLWSGRALGPHSIIDLFAFDRPLVGYIYSTVYRLLGENALLWQIYTFTIRLIGALSFFWFIRRLWPSKKVETTTAAVLMFVYPGFLQWANAMTKSNHLTTYTVALVSIALTVAAMQSKQRSWKVVWTLAALTSAVIYWFLYEYMIGLEGLRLLIIGLVVWRYEQSGVLPRFRRILESWALYFAFIAANLVYRLFFFESGRPGMSVDSALAPYQDRLLPTIAKRLLELIIDVYETLISAWVVPINSSTFGLEPRSLVLSFFLALIAIALFAAYYLTFRDENNAGSQAQNQSNAGIEMTVIGGATILLTLFPVIAVGRDVRWESGFDKYTLQATAGVALFLVGALSALIRSDRKWTLFALLIGISIASQTGNAIQWRTFWEDQKELWWQLSWRAPSIKDETVLLVEMPGKDFFEAYEVWGPASRIYAPDTQTIQIRAEVFSAQTLEKIRHGQSETRGVRSVLNLERDFSKSLILSRPSRTSCWHVIDGEDPILPEHTTPLLYSAVRRSKIGQIDLVASTVSPPEHIFGAEPAHGWCYYFQRGSLAAQRGAWQMAAELADQALADDQKPVDRSEWIPFLRAYVMLGRDDDAREMSLWIRDNGVIRHRQCDYLSDTALPDPDRQTFLRELLCK
ncbi:MAG: hypothetical protein PVG04_08865 [Anaerolineales bacterium]|jgi:hypothetical protein